MKRRSVWQIVTAVLIVLGASACEGAWAGDVAVEVVSDGRGALQSIPCSELRKAGTLVVRRYLEARPGENYGIRVSNKTGRRMGIVIAVDGRNIIDGKRSDLGRREAMYIVNGYETAVYDGWRTSRQHVHRFYFTDTQDSYSMSTFSDSSALGVIAVAVFPEKQPEPSRGLLRRESPSAAPSTEASGPPNRKALADERAATGFGDERYSPVATVRFDPEPRPVQKTLIRYEWRETLCRNGILRCVREQRNRLWDGDGYAPYPPGYPRG